MPIAATDSVEVRLSELLIKNESQILAAWVAEQLAAITRRADLTSETDLRQQSKAFLAEFAAGTQTGSLTNVDGAPWASMRSLLNEMSRARAIQGFTPSETATFILSLRGVLMDQLQKAHGKDAASLAAGMRACNLLLDKLALITVDAALGAREEIIKRQQEEMLELSTPVVQLLPGVLGLPLIGTLDSARTQIVMENLLQRIMDTASTIAIIDITGVATVDTLVAQHLLKTVAATRLMGADCIISGIRPQIAQTIVHLGVELQDVSTKATLADALALALQKLGLTVQKTGKDAARGN